MFSLEALSHCISSSFSGAQFVVISDRIARRLGSFEPVDSRSLRRLSALFEPERISPQLECVVFISRSGLQIVDDVRVVICVHGALKKVVIPERRPDSMLYVFRRDVW